MERYTRARRIRVDNNHFQHRIYRYDLFTQPPLTPPVLVWVTHPHSAQP